jgi:hypothetical protein
MWFLRPIVVGEPIGVFRIMNCDEKKTAPAYLVGGCTLMLRRLLATAYMILCLSTDTSTIDVYTYVLPITAVCATVRKLSKNQESKLLQHRPVPYRPQNLDPPPLDLPKPIICIPHKLDVIQRPRCIRRILHLQRIFRPNMVRNCMRGQSRRVRAILHRDADIADDVCSDDFEHAVDEGADCGPTLDNGWADGDGHGFVF